MARHQWTEIEGSAQGYCAGIIRDEACARCGDRRRATYERPGKVARGQFQPLCIDADGIWTRDDTREKSGPCKPTASE